MSLWKFTILFIAAATLFGCDKSDDNSDEDVQDSTSNATVMAYAVVGGAAGSTEGGALMSVARLVENVSPLATCNYASARTCSSDICTVNWNDCTVESATLSGGWTEDYNTAGCASNFFSGSCSVERTTLTNGFITTFANNATLTTSSDSHTNWSGTTVAGGTSISYDGSSARTLNINGLQRILRGPKGRTWFNHSMRTTTPFNVTGRRSTNNRVVNSGVLVIDHNVLNYSATNTFDTTNKVTWGDSTCCYPTSGKITTTFTGSVIGSASLVFSSECGSATFTNTSGASSTLELSYCE